jgi:hypothetical protein
VIFKRGGSHGVGVDTGAAPDITYDGKWSGWYIETYGGLPYWEAVFYTSGVLTVTGEYNSEWWGIGGGAFSYGDPAIAGRGSSSIIKKIISGTHTVTIGAGASDIYGAPGGNTMLDSASIGAGGVLGAPGGGFPYRFGDPDKAGEEGESGEKYAQGTSWTYGYGEGGWLHWGINFHMSDHGGRGYGAGGALRLKDGALLGGHVGAAVCRIPA